MHCRFIAITLLTLVCFGNSFTDAKAQDKKKQNTTYTDPKKVDEDYAFQGEYSGTLEIDGTPTKIGFHVIALGDGKFQGLAYQGGLPGDGWDQQTKIPMDGEGKLKDGKVRFQSEHAQGVIENGVMKVTDFGDNEMGELKRVVRKSKTLGQKAPDGAVVLFDGSNADEWKGGKVDKGLLVQGTTSKKTFGSHSLHLEFLLPYKPFARGQARGNSGIYVQGRYEVQMLDSFGLEGKMNECGGIYSVSGVKENMCYPPLQWQTYDIDYTAAKYDGDKLVENPRMTVKHNGVVIHDDIELPGKRNTTAAPLKAGPQKGPIYLQNHGNPVRYRNIWVVEK